MDDREFSVVCSAMDDCRRLIAAGKVQRWDVVKWGIAVNLGLAAVSASGAGSILLLFLIAVAVSTGSLSLMWHYNTQITGARDTATRSVKIFEGAGLKYNSLVPGDPAHDYSREKTTTAKS